MKHLSSVIALVTVLLLPGCGGDTVADIDCAIEIQVAVVSGMKPGDTMTDGDWRVAASCVLPIHSTGGPGHVVSTTDGVIIELQWSDVRMLYYGKVIAFSDSKWAIKNRIVRRDGISQLIGGHLLNNTTNFGNDFVWLATCELDTGLSDTTLRQQSNRRLVIRGRLLPGSPLAQPLNLSELTESGE